ncbi:MAG: DNA adenine methylase, partial [Candidatus Cloacimonadales bacterium]|nr:DNA adenine methylase [Candidatus Cloacimonadales bacterium]
MRYYGNKTKLLPFIEEVVKQTKINGSSTFFDLFSGTSSVGKHFKKKGFRVCSNDILEFAYSIAKAYIELNRKPEFIGLKIEFKLNSNAEILNYLNELEDKYEGFIYKNYSPKGKRRYFTEENALKIDIIRKQIYEWRKEKLITELEQYYLITSLLNAINLVSNVSGTYAAFLKKWDKRALKKIVLNEIEIIESKQKNLVFKEDANKLINEINPDILYLDPPYNCRQYASNYFILELVAEGWFEQEPIIYGQTGMREYSNQKSKYCSKNFALSELNDLIEKANSKCILLSYNNEGIIAEEEINDILNKKGNVQVFEFEHKRYRSIN